MTDSRKYHGFYVLNFSQESLFAANTIPLKTKKLWAMKYHYVFKPIMVSHCPVPSSYLPVSLILQTYSSERILILL